MTGQAVFSLPLYRGRKGRKATEGEREIEGRNLAVGVQSRVLPSKWTNAAPSLVSGTSNKLFFSKFVSIHRVEQLCHFEVLSARPRQGTCSQQADEPVDKEMEQFMTRRRMFFGQQAINVIWTTSSVSIASSNDYVHVRINDTHSSLDDTGGAH
jgi:hypothetical protein